MVVEKVTLVLTNLLAKGLAFAHPECDWITGMCTWFCALWIGTVSCAKFDILSNCGKLSHNLYGMCWLELLGFFHCCRYNLQDVLLALTLILIIYQQPFWARIHRMNLIVLQVWITRVSLSTAATWTDSEQISDPSHSICIYHSPWIHLHPDPSLYIKSQHQDKPHRYHMVFISGCKMGSNLTSSVSWSSSPLINWSATLFFWEVSINLKYMI